MGEPSMESSTMSSPNFSSQLPAHCAKRRRTTTHAIRKVSPDSPELTSSRGSETSIGCPPPLESGSSRTSVCSSQTNSPRTPTGLEALYLNPSKRRYLYDSDDESDSEETSDMTHASLRVESAEQSVGWNSLLRKMNK